MEQPALQYEQVSSNMETGALLDSEGGTATSPPAKRHRFQVAMGSLLLGVLVVVVLATRNGNQSDAKLSSIMNKAESEGGICMITIMQGCNCANCDAHVNTVDGEEKCFSTLAVKDTDDDNGECHEYTTKCTLEVGTKYQVKCEGDWDSGANLKIGNSVFCDKTAETKEFVAEAAPIVPLKEQYDAIMDNKAVKDVMEKYDGWTKTLRDCIGTFEPPFDEGKATATAWDDIDPTLKGLISAAPTCEDPSVESGMFKLQACIDKMVADAKHAESEDDDW